MPLSVFAAYRRVSDPARTRETLFGPNSFAGYTARFQHGPFQLEQQMRVRLNSELRSSNAFRNGNAESSK